MVCAVAALLPIGPSHAAQENTVLATIDSGILKGDAADGIAVFKGIPYAAVPVGALRWRPPQPVPPWVGERLATEYGNDCLQNRFFADSAPSSEPMSEDCLYLNLWTPTPQAGARLPVMVWIHGGGSTTGSGAPSAYAGAQLARKGVVVATFNYRLGRFGFFAHPALAQEHPDEPLGNYGLMDQIAALDWVHRNIAQFGGDPGNVTVFGESAGGAAILRLMISPPAKTLFHRAIVQSGGGRDHWVRLDEAIADRPSAFSIGEAFARHAGLATADAAALRAIPAKTVLGNLGLMNGEAEIYSGPMVDGRIVPGDIDTLFAARSQALVPLMIGANSDELGALPGFILDIMTKRVMAKLGDRGAALDAQYSEGRTRRADLFDDLAFVEPSRYFAGCQIAAGAPAWLYRFSYVAEAKRSAAAGAFHASEIPYVFNTLGTVAADATEADRAMADTISDYWVAFARSGDPNGAGRPDWPRFAPDTGALMNFTADGSRPGPDPAKARLDAIAALDPVL
jgi:para-nitrobenzyl esterase